MRMRARGPRLKKQELKLRSQLVGLSPSLQRAKAERVCGGVGVPPTGQEKWVLAIRVSNSKPGQENSSNSQLSYGYLGKVAQLGALSGPQFLGI